jgi:viroplasmin and RNaseH domain-containing protein
MMTSNQLDENHLHHKCGRGTDPLENWRSAVSNDNAYSEALFKTLKYTPGYPGKPFESIEKAQGWVSVFQHWYNEIHHHSALKFGTPSQHHKGEDIDILANRKAIYEAARKLRPERWSGSTRDWEPTQVVCLNPKKSKQQLSAYP